VRDVIIASISFTEMFAKVLAKDISFYDEINLKEAYKEAGLMNFGIKLPKSKR
jgi:hypothetical protein